MLLLFAIIASSANASIAVSGRVLGYLANRIGDYDRLRLRTTTGEVQLHFPPHTATRVRQLAVVGQFVAADTEPGHGRPGGPSPELPETGLPAVETYRLVVLRNPTTGMMMRVADLPPPPPQAGRLVQTEGPLIGDIHDETGLLAALLTDKYLIELKPHQGEQISSLLVGVRRIGVVGYERPPDGFVNRTGRPLLHPTALTIRGQTFAL